MQRKLRLLMAAATLVVAISACAATWAGPKILLPDDPAGDDVRAAAKSFYEKLAAGDAAGAKELFDGPHEQAELLEAYIRFVTATGKLSDATAAKFGRKGDERLKAFNDALVRARAEQLPQEPISLNGDLASVATLSPFNCGSDLHRVGGKWKVTHLTIEPGRARGLIELLGSAAAAADDVRAQVDSGTITGAEAVAPALDERVKAALRAYLLGPKEAGKQTPPRAARSGASPEARPATGPALGAAELGPLIGKKFASPEVQRVIDALPGAPHLGAYQNGPTGSLYVTSPETGLSLLFVLPGGQLRSVFLYGEGDEGNQRFRGNLPEGLSMADSRGDVERKLGPPPTSGGGWRSNYYASYPGRGIYIEYASGAVTDPAIPIAHISLSAPRPEADKPATRPAKPAKPANGTPRLAIRLVATDAKPEDPAVEFLPTLDSSDRGEKLPVSREVLLDQGDVAELSPQPDAGGGTSMSLTMTEAGAKRLEQVTKANVGKRLAVVFDDLVLVAPTIRDPVSKSVVVSFGASTPEDERYEIVGRLHAALTALPATPGAATAAPSSSTREATTPTERSGGKD